MIFCLTEKRTFSLRSSVREATENQIRSNIKLRPKRLVPLFLYLCRLKTHSIQSTKKKNPRKTIKEQGSRKTTTQEKSSRTASPSSNTATIILKWPSKKRRDAQLESYWLVRLRIRKPFNGDKKEHRPLQSQQ